MKNFVDPRTDPAPDSTSPGVRTTDGPEELEELQELCRDGKLYEVERWIQADRPLQLAERVDLGRRRWNSALEIALASGNHALTLLLLCNGYDPNLERHCPLDRALSDRRSDLLDLLLEWGADPQQVSLRELFGTYSTDLFERFWKLGVDLSAGHALARALAHHTSNTPLFGFAKKHREEVPGLQTELNIALRHHAEEGNGRGVGLCLWAGADPHTPAPDLQYDDGSEDEHVATSTAVRVACRNGNTEILEELGPDPREDDFDELYRAADSRRVVDYLAEIALPEDPNEVIRHHVWWVTLTTGLTRRVGRYRSVSTLKRLFEVGLRWEESSKEDIGRIRRSLIKAPDRTFVDVMKLLATKDYCAPDIRYELARTPAIRRRMKEVGFIPSEGGKRKRSGRHRPTGSRDVLRKFGVGINEKPKPERPLPEAVHIGRWRSDGAGIRMDREELFDRVWSSPVSKLAEEWGLSGRGLSKACKRLEIPTPPRGYWQKRRAGKQVTQPELPEIPEGQAEEIVIWTTD